MLAFSREQCHAETEIIVKNVFSRRHPASERAFVIQIQNKHPNIVNSTFNVDLIES